MKASTLASAAAFVPQFLQAFQAGRLENSRTGKILVVVQLSGGNDGLNTIVPYRNDRYYQLRPRLALKPEEILPVSDELGFNPSLAPLRELYDQGWMSIVNSVGYPNPDRSHFRSMDIWHTASGSDEYWSTGWRGRYLDHHCTGCPAHHALEIDSALSLSMKGQDRTGFAMSNPQQLQKTANNKFLQTLRDHDHHDEENVAYLYKTLIDTQSSADYLAQRARRRRSRVKYPVSAFAKDLKQIAELITADCDTRIYYVSLTGFDTHANQRNRQGRLLRQYAEGMAAFVKDLQQNNLLNATLILTFSEFGRRAAQNASNGTDHGTANNLFLMGGKLQTPGFFNAAPNLDRLDKKDLIYEIDFRQIYSTILDRWLDSDADRIMGRDFQRLALV